MQKAIMRVILILITDKLFLKSHFLLSLLLDHFLQEKKVIKQYPKIQLC